MTLDKGIDKEKMVLTTLDIFQCLQQEPKSLITLVEPLNFSTLIRRLFSSFL
jgi:hypothetical protein